MIEVVIKPAGARWWWAVLVDGIARRQGFARNKDAAERDSDFARKENDERQNWCDWTLDQGR